MSELSRSQIFRVRAELGIRGRWGSANDADEVRDHHSGLFKRWKEEQGFSPDTVPLDTIPDLIPSIQKLYDYGYSPADIAVMFGVTDACVGNWSRKYGLDFYRDSRGSLPRLWDDEKHCFVVVTNEELVEKLQEKRAHAEQERKDRERARHIESLKRLAEKLGRVPGLNEWVRFIGASGWTGLAQTYWGAKEHSYSKAADKLYRAAGFRKRRKRGFVRRMRGI